MPRGLLLENFRLGAPEQRREHGAEDRRGGGGLEPEADEVGYDFSEVGGREHHGGAISCG
jgi:hypothetical protein